MFLFLFYCSALSRGAGLTAASTDSPWGEGGAGNGPAHQVRDWIKLSNVDLFGFMALVSQGRAMDKERE